MFITNRSFGFFLCLCFVVYCNGKVLKNLVLYDGVCKFCNTWVGLALKFDIKSQITFCALQSQSGKQVLSACGRQDTDISSIVYIPSIDLSDTISVPVKHYLKSEAVVQIGEQIGLLPIQTVSSLLPLMLKDNLYDIVATNRYNILGKYSECRLYHLEYEDRFLVWKKVRHKRSYTVYLLSYIFRSITNITML